MEQKNNSGAIFRNEKKDKTTAPDYTGSITIEGKKFAVSGWINTSKDGKNYLRLLVMPAQAKEWTGTAEMPF